jgi:hypothetical protein
MFGAAEWRLGVDHPLSPAQRMEQGVKRTWAGKAQPACRGSIVASLGSLGG